MADLPISLLPKAYTGYSDSLMVIVNYNDVPSGVTYSIPYSAVTQSGTSGTSGSSGSSGTSGSSGSSGTSGINGTSGTSGINGIDGTSGTSGIDGTSGTSGIDGTSGTSGISGIASGQILYFNSQINQSPYFELSQYSSNLSQTGVTTSVPSLTTGVIATYQTPSGYSVESIPAGIWSFYLHGYKQNINASFRIYCDVYKRDTGGTETLLFSSDPVNITTNSPNIEMYISDIYQTGYTLDPTDRIVVKVMGQNYGNLATAHTLTFITEGLSHNSYINTTLNYLAGTSGTSGTSGTDGTSGTSGTDGTSGTSGITPSLPTKSWGSFISLINQYVVSTTTAYSMSAETQTSASGVSVLDNCKFVVASAGTYNLQFSAQIESTGGGNTQTMEIWLSINGNNVPHSNTQVVGNSNNGRNVAAWNFVEPMNDGDYFEIKFRTSDVRLGFIYDAGPFTNPTRPDIPSVIVTVTQV